MPHVTLPQGRVDYVDEGDATGVPVVFVHGFLTDGELWAATGAALGGRARVIRPTWPLGSHRTPMTESLDPGQVADLVVAFMDELGLEDPILVGNDSGGAVSQLVVARHPDRLRRLVLTNCDAFTELPPQPFAWFRYVAKVPGLLAAILAPLRISRLRHTLFYGQLASARHRDLWDRFFAPYASERRIRRQASDFVARASTADLLAATGFLGEWEGEVVIVWGMRDIVFRPSLGRRLAAAAGAPLIPVPDAKAFVPLDSPQVVADVIAAVAAGAPLPVAAEPRPA